MLIKLCGDPVFTTFKMANLLEDVNGLVIKIGKEQQYIDILTSQDDVLRVKVNNNLKKPIFLASRISVSLLRYQSNFVIKSLGVVEYRFFSSIAEMELIEKLLLFLNKLLPIGSRCKASADFVRYVLAMDLKFFEEEFITQFLIDAVVLQLGFFGGLVSQSLEPWFICLEREINQVKLAAGAGMSPKNILKELQSKLKFDFKEKKKRMILAQGLFD